MVSQLSIHFPHSVQRAARGTMEMWERSVGLLPFQLMQPLYSERNTVFTKVLFCCLLVGWLSDYHQAKIRVVQGLERNPSGGDAVVARPQPLWAPPTPVLGLCSYVVDSLPLSPSNEQTLRPGMT